MALIRFEHGVSALGMCVTLLFLFIAVSFDLCGLDNEAVAATSFDDDAVAAASAIMGDCSSIPT